MGFVRRWFSVLMTRLTPYMYGNGGPIIMVQVSKRVVCFVGGGVSLASSSDHAKAKTNAGGK
jgi:hypothetical protein